jgi:hypothetical protein
VNGGRPHNTVLNQDSDNPDSFIGKQSHSPNSELELAIQQEERDQEGIQIEEKDEPVTPAMTPGRAEIEKRFSAMILWRQALIILAPHCFMVIAFCSEEA